jgi:NDP-sugar pyrophosphorylase family protein
MKAVIIVPEQKASACPSVPCVALFPLLDRPFLQHVVEAVARRGVREVQFVLGPGADAVVEHFGDGTRWGCAFAYHLIADPNEPGGVLRSLVEPGEYVLVATADQLPALPTVLRATPPGLLFGTPGSWSGWAVVRGEELSSAGGGALRDLGPALAEKGLKWVDVGRPVTFRSVTDVPEAQQRLLRGDVPCVLVTAQETAPGVWLAPNTRVADTSTLVPPAFVGANTVIGPGAVIGPNAVVGPDCMIDRGAHVRDATVCAGTYVGTGVELSGVVADGRCLVNPRLRTVATIDRQLLDRLATGLPLVRSLEPLLAGAALVAAAPVVLAAALWLWLTRPGPVFWQRRFVTTPAPAAESTWDAGTAYTLVPPQEGDEERGWVVPATFRGLVLELLPALGAVAMGRLRLVGLPPRRRTALRAHGTEYPPILRAPAGLISEAALCPTPPTAADRLLVDVYQTQTSVLATNLWRVGRFLAKALTAWGAPPRATAATRYAVGRTGVLAVEPPTTAVVSAPADLTPELV